jgi:hypothetical protein
MIDEKGPAGGRLAGTAGSGLSAPPTEDAMDQRRETVQVTYKVKVTARLVWHIVAPYAYEKLVEQLKALPRSRCSCFCSSSSCSV